MRITIEARDNKYSEERYFVVIRALLVLCGGSVISFLSLFKRAGIFEITKYKN